MVRGPIGVFDSGLGGLTVLRALIDLLPDEDFLYFGDTGRFPYGPKPSDEVVKYSMEITDLLLARGASMIVVACNSAASVSLELLRERSDVPVFGVVRPGIRAGVKVTASGRVGVIGTVGTIASGAYQEEAARLAAETGRALEVTCAACPGFVEFVERGETDSDQVRVLAERLLAPVLAADIDTLVLGCTHYPLLARTITAVTGPDVMLVSSADELAFEVYGLLHPQGRSGSTTRSGRREFVTSGEATTFLELGGRFLGPEVESVETWSWT